MTKTNWVVIGLVVIVLGVVAGIIWGMSEKEVAQAPSGPQNAFIQGVVMNTAASARTFTVQENENFYPVAVDANTKIYDEGGGDAAIAYIHRGFDVSVEGHWSSNNSILASVVRVTRAPAIIIYSPTNEQIVSDAVITVTGIARVFESSLMVRVRTSTTTVLVEEPVMADAPDVGQYGEFNYTFTLSKNVVPGEKVYIDAFEYSAKDGTQINLATVIIYITHRQTTTVKTYFNNDRLDPAITCTNVFEVQRVIPYTQSVGQAAINELLMGPIEKEPGLGYYTNIPTGTRIKSLRIENGTAYADFDENLDKNIGGSCRMSAIRAQITETLKQFPTVQNVIISVNGNSAEALQP